MMLALRQEEQLAVRVMAAMLGTVLLFSPWIMGAAPDTGSLSAWATGFLILTVGIGAAVNRNSWPDWLVLLIGLWCVAAPSVIDLSGPAEWAHMIVGTLVSVLAAFGLGDRLRSGRPQVA